MCSQEPVCQRSCWWEDANALLHIIRIKKHPSELKKFTKVPQFFSHDRNVTKRIKQRNSECKTRGIRTTLRRRGDVAAEPRILTESDAIYPSRRSSHCGKIAILVEKSYFERFTYKNEFDFWRQKSKDEFWIFEQNCVFTAVWGGWFTVGYQHFSACSSSNTFHSSFLLQNLNDFCQN